MYGPLGLASGLGGMEAFLLRLPGDGVDGVTEDDVVSLATGEFEGGEVRAGSLMSKAFCCCWGTRY